MMRTYEPADDDTAMCEWHGGLVSVYELVEQTDGSLICHGCLAEIERGRP